MLIALALALQAAPEVPQRFSILTPVANEPCRPREKPDGDVIVCADPIPDQQLPYPDEVANGPPRAVNPNLTGAGALAAEGTPCAASQRGCTVGFGPPIAPLVAGAVGLIKDAFAKKPDKTGRVSIPLDDPAPAGR
ncbi:hypothetical protein M0208_13795 [Sphingomonas sp. SUN019]|uniref:hypothetical protein n=1 Tax=Sphingomonas sp. SUN019 TaxID=2937788 RepID=UPI0021640CBF|nr:hypothetical protein [Sphingomonas sp. SUN019]UVO51521.1 hypothetical protein M0208_13795 [Sphingomonas sp. SUN019]